MPYPYTTNSIADALAYAHERAYAATAQAVLILDPIRKAQGRPIGGPQNKRIGYKLVGPNKVRRRYVPDWEQRTVLARIAELHEKDGLGCHAIGRLLEAERRRADGRLYGRT